MKNTDKKALVDWLDERLKIATTLNRPEDELFYRGDCSAIEKNGLLANHGRERSSPHRQKMTTFDRAGTVFRQKRNLKWQK